jgi:nitrogen fixation/metabolism regulation signal transduction histidine kinase
MVSKRYYLFLLLRISFLAATSFIFFLGLSVYPNLSLLIILGSLFLLQVFLLVRFLYKINRTLEHYFEVFLSGEISAFTGRKPRSRLFLPMFGYFSRISEKLEAARLEAEIRNRYFKTLVDQTSVGLISFRDDGSVEFFNDAAQRIFNLHVLRSLDRLDTLKEGLSMLLMGMRANEIRSITYPIQGEIVNLSIRKAIIRAGEESLNLVSIQNIKPELEENEVESWQKLIRVITHEIMNSITPITTLVSTITRLYKEKENGKLKPASEISEKTIEKTIKGLELIDSRGQGLVHFVQNYKHVTHLPKPVFKEFFIGELLHRILLLFEQQLISSKVVYTIDCDSELKINADERLLEQVLINLIKNSIEAAEGQEHPAVRTSAYLMNTQTVIEVCDNGKGIPPDLIEDIFVPFFTTKQTGSGIGLSLSRQIIRLHGGTLNVQSEPFVKTCFTIKI